MSYLNKTMEIINGLYGPKLCPHCNSVQPIIVHKKEGSDFSRMEGMTFISGFVGVRHCATCFKDIDKEKTPIEPIP